MYPKPRIAPKLTRPPRREKAVTLIASLKCVDGIVLAADSEEQITEPPTLRTTREKIRFLQRPAVCDWSVITAGSGEFDYIGMIGDLIEDSLMDVTKAGTLTLSEDDIQNCIRSAVAMVWRDYARYEQRTIDVKLLVLSRASQPATPRLTVVSGAAVRRGADVEAIGIGDATFKALTDKFVNHGLLSTASISVASARIFMVYAMLQAKLSIPGIGGTTRILAVTENDTRFLKSWSVGAIQRFFGGIDSNIRSGVMGLAYPMQHLVSPTPDPVENFIKALSDEILNDYRQLRAELDEVEKDDRLV